MANKQTQELSQELAAELLRSLKARFEKNIQRHPGFAWADVEARLLDHPQKLWSLNEMERTGGEPDVVDWDAKTGEYVFFDCAAESPKERRSLCYDSEAWESRKEFKPGGNVLDMAKAMGIELLHEEQYHFLQTKGSFDTKTSSWLHTLPGVRKLGGAIFGDHRYGRVFIYHNGASSYYAARGFRGALRV